MQIEFAGLGQTSDGLRGPVSSAAVALPHPHLPTEIAFGPFALRLRVAPFPLPYTSTCDPPAAALMIVIIVRNAQKKKRKIKEEPR